MNTPFRPRSSVLRRAISAIAVFALLIGSVSGIAFTSIAYANNGIHTYAVPLSGTLSAGDTLEVHMTVAIDPNDTNPIISPTCLVNGVEVKDTFAILETGHFRVSYTVGSGDAPREAGQVPISCTLQQTNSVTVTAFDDSNTVAIQPVPDSGGDTTPPPDETATTTPPGDTTPPPDETATTTPPGDTTPPDEAAPPNSGITASASPNSGVLRPGDALEVRFGDPTLTTGATSPTCLVNGVEVKDTFRNESPGVYAVTYTVGASDSNQSAGNIPLSCTLSERATVTVTEWTDGNSLAIDASSQGGGSGPGATTPQISASISPASGSVRAGQSAEVTFTEKAGQTDIAIAGACKVNNVDVSGTFTNLGSGRYKVVYTVGESDGERPAGMILLDCALGNSAGTVRVQHPWTDGNALAVDTNGDGTIDNGTNTLGFTVTASPDTGMLRPGDTLSVLMQNPLPSADLSVGEEGCRVNGIDVSGSLTHLGNGLYRVSYVVGENDQSREPGTVPVQCTLENQTGSVHLMSFTDSNTIGIDAAAESEQSPDEDPFIAGVFANPDSGTLAEGDTLEIYVQEGTGAEDFTGGPCMVNSVDVSGTFENLTSGFYKFRYTAVRGHAERSSGEIPISCSLVRAGNADLTFAAFTDANTLAIDFEGEPQTGGTGSGSGSTGGNGTVQNPSTQNPVSFTSVSANPNSGYRSPGDHLMVHIQESHNATDLAIAGTCAVNGVAMTNLEHLGNGHYRLDYLIGPEDAERPAGTVPVNCTLSNGSGASATIQSFNDGNTVAIVKQIPSTPSGNTGGNSGNPNNNATTTTGNGTNGDTNGSQNESNADATSTVDIFWASVTPNSGTLNEGGIVYVYFQETNLRADLAVSGSCAINGVSAPLESLGSGLYRLTYVVGSGHRDRAPGELPINCSLRGNDGGTAVISSFSDANTLGIDVNGNGSFADTGSNSGQNGEATTTPDGTGATTTPDGTATTTGALAVDTIIQDRSSAVAGAGFESGWAWTFNVTVPANELDVQIKFGDWTHANGSTTMDMEQNMRVHSPQASSTDPIIMTAAGIYEEPMRIVTDLDPSKPGYQIQIKVEMKIPEGALSGSYGTYYGIQSTEASN